MKTFAPGDRVVAINFMSVPLYEDGDWSQHPYLLPDGPLRKDVIYHVAGTVMRPNGMQGVFLTGIRVMWGSQEIPWASTRFRKVDIRGPTFHRAGSRGSEWPGRAPP